MNKDYIEELNIIAKTRLFFANHQKLNEFTGLNFSLGNNATKMSFERRAKAFEKLSERANELSNEQLKLEKVIDIYKKISNYITKDRTKSKNKDNIIVENYLDNFLYQGDLSALETAIMVLILLGLLPVANTNKGFDDTESFEDDFEKMFDFLGNYIKNTDNIIIKNRPILQLHQDEFQRNLCDKDKAKWISRFMLIFRTYNILMDIQKFSTKENRIQANYSLNWIQPTIVGIWCVSDHLNTNDFYKIEYDISCLFWLTHYQKTTEGFVHQRSILGINKLDENSIEFIIYGPKFERLFLEQKDTSLELNTFYCSGETTYTQNYPNNDNTIKIINLYPKYTPNCTLEKLYRVKDDKLFYKITEKSKCITEKKYCSEKSLIYAVTKKNLYIELSDNDKNILDTDKKYLVLSRTGKFVKFNCIDNYLFLNHFGDDVIYLDIEIINEYYKITDQEVFKELNLKFSDTIE